MGTKAKLAASDEDIYHYLLGDFVIGGMYKAPHDLRPGDKYPSFGVYEKDGELLWYDFGLAREAQGNDALGLLREMRGVGHLEALKIIDREILPGRLGRPALQLTKTDNYKSLPFVTWRDHNDHELQYWRRHGQTQYDLIYENIWALDYLQYNDNAFRVQSYENDPAFVYVFNKNPLSCKLYRPYNKAYKFRMFNMETVIEGWESMVREYENLGQRFETLYITSSTKDRLCWKKCCEISESCINPISEKIFRAIVQKKDELYGYAKQIIVIFDGDDTGRQMAIQLSQDLGASHIDVTQRLGYDDSKQEYVKDLARHTELWGTPSLRQIKTQLI